MSTRPHPASRYLARGAAAAVLLWLAAIVVVITGELLPGDSTPMTWISATHLSDKLIHFSAYVALAFIPVLGFRLAAGLAAAAAMVLLGVALEFGQTLIPRRSFEPADMIANTAGVLAGTALALLLRRFLRVSASRR